SDILGVLAGFFDVQQNMLTGPAGTEVKLLFDNKIVCLLAQKPCCCRFAIQILPCWCSCHAPTSSTTASAAIPSLRPTKPSCSVVVALTLTCDKSQFKSAAMH